MRRSGIGIVILSASLGLLTGCVGKNSGGSGGGGVKTVSLSPGGNHSIDVGATQIFTATATNALGLTVVASTIQFNVVSANSNPAPLVISANGAGCAGTWDSTGTICSPGSPGIAIVTATVEGVSSAPATVYVHQHIDNIQVAPIGIPNRCGQPTCPCFSQGQTWDYQAIVYDLNHRDITDTVGPINWSTSNASVLTVNSITGLLQSQVQVTARTPGITELFASVSNATSTPTPYTTCLVKYLRLQAQGETGNTFSLATGAKTITATVVDTLDVTLASPPLTWSSSNPEVASFSSATNTSGNNSITARVNAGSTDITASCTPPTCNVGVLPGLPVYASGGNLPVGGQPVGLPAFGVISEIVTPTKEPTYSAWAATTQCNNALNCQSYTFALTPGNTPVGASALMSRTPNSMMFNQQGARIYFGSDQGLMFLDAGGTSVTPVSAASTPCHVSLCGKVLAISPDGNRVVVSDTISNPHQVYIYNASPTSTAPIDLVLSNPTEKAIAAAFSPDEMKLFILTDAGTMYVYSTVDALTSFSVGTSATDLVFSADGSFALVAGAPTSAVSAFGTCNLADLGSVVLTSTPTKIFPAPNVLGTTTDPTVTQTLIALAPPIIQTLTVNFTQNDLKNGQLACNAPVVSFPAPLPPAINLGQGTFSPLYMRVVGNGTGVVVVAKLVPAVLFVDLIQQTTTPVPLANNGLPLAASASSDGTQVFVAACDVYPSNDPTHCTSGSVHIINTLSGGDIQQVPYTNFNTNNSMCTVATAPPCFPDLIAIKAQ